MNGQHMAKRRSCVTSIKINDLSTKYRLNYRCTSVLCFKAILICTQIQENYYDTLQNTVNM